MNAGHKTCCYTCAAPVTTRQHIYLGRITVTTRTDKARSYKLCVHKQPRGHAAALTLPRSRPPARVTTQLTPMAMAQGTGV